MRTRRTTRLGGRERGVAAVAHAHGQPLGACRSASRGGSGPSRRSGRSCGARTRRRVEIVRLRALTRIETRPAAAARRATRRAGRISRPRGAQDAPLGEPDAHRQARALAGERLQPRGGAPTPGTEPGLLGDRQLDAQLRDLHAEGPVARAEGGRVAAEQLRAAARDPSAKR